LPFSFLQTDATCSCPCLGSSGDMTGRLSIAAKAFVPPPGSAGMDFMDGYEVHPDNVELLQPSDADQATSQPSLTAAYVFGEDDEPTTENSGQDTEGPPSMTSLT